MMIDDDRRQNTFGLMMSLNMLIEMEDGFDYTGGQFDTWCKSAGFTRTEVLSLAGPSSAAIAYMLAPLADWAPSHRLAVMCRLPTLC